MPLYLYCDIKKVQVLEEKKDRISRNIVITKIPTMKILLHVLAYFVMLVTQIHAQSVRDFSHKGNLDWKTFKSEEQTSAVSLSTDKEALSLDTNDDLQLVDTQDDQLGFRHYRYQQTYKDIPIEGAIFLMHELNGRLKNINGRLTRNLDLSTTPAISEATALHAAMQHVDASLYAWNDTAHETNLKHTHDCSDSSFYPHGELVIFASGKQKKADDYRLAYKFDIYALQPLTRQIVYVDAQSNMILTSIEKIHNCTGTPASGATNYSGDVDFSACTIGGTRTLKSNDTGVDIQVFDAENTWASPQVTVTDTDGFFEQDSTAVEVYWATKETYDYFFYTHGRNSLDDNGMALYSWVHHGVDYNNAFWNGSWMTYGDGDNQQFSSFTSPDAVGHEIMHGITDFSADLIYQDESGALNESFSDIFGELVEAYIRGTNDWIVGADFTVQAGKNGLRNLSNPKDINMMRAQPDTYFGDNWFSGGGRGGVHTNSGVQNYWFYLLAQGGTGVNDFGYEYNIQGIGISKAAAIAYRNLTVYLTPESQYFDARIGSIQSAIDLYGLTSEEVKQTKAAWEAVGVGTYTTTPCRERDSLALVALYDATNGANWAETWDLTQPIDTWYGVSLNQGGCVSALDLNSNQLEGEIPAELGDLVSLLDLRLQHNSLSGTIPSELSDLIYLEVLNMGFNQLQGSIPSELGNLISLAQLGLNSNQLSGTIPETLSNLTKLNLLFLGNNQLTGEIISGVGGMSNLVNLDLGLNQLTGKIPAELGNLIYLTNLSLGGNQLTGEIPDKLGNLINLKSLILTNNQLEGEFPVWIGNLPYLTSLALSSNQLSGCYPSNVANLCSQLTSLNDNSNISNGNNFNNTWESFCAIGAGRCNPYSPCRDSDSLALVAFYNSLINDPLVWNLNQPIDTWNGVTLSPKGCVIHIELDDGYLSGNIPAEIGDLSHLTVLDVDENQISGAIPPELGDLTTLEYIDLSDNGLSGNIPPELGDLTALEYIDLSANGLSDNIPPELGELAQLSYLDLTGNGLSGTIPPELGDLSELTTLLLGFNELTGAIPVELGTLNYLKRLNLSNNQLSGSIPAEIGNLSNLISIHLLGNQLTGSIPPEISNLSYLEHLYVSDNQLSGCFAPELLNLCSQLSEVDVNQGNNFYTTWGNLCNTGAGVCSSYSLCRQGDSLVLVEFYNANPNANLQWNLNESMDTWYGVTLSIDGCVEGIDFVDEGVAYIPPEFGDLAHLKFLDLHENSLSGIFPLELLYLTTLEHLTLGGNNFSGEIPEEIGNLVNLKHLDLSDNDFSGNIPSELGNLANLESLYLSGNELTGNIPGELGNLTNLTRLYLSYNYLTGCYASNLTNLCGQLVNYNFNSTITQLEATWEGFCNIGEGMCDAYSPCRQSDSLALVAFHNAMGANVWDISSNMSTWDGIRLSPEGCVIEIELDNGILSGSIPSEIGDLSHLVVLDLHENNIGGSIPSELGNLTDLKYLRLGYNAISGEIPSELGNLTKLEYLDLSLNELSGSILPELGNLSNLKYLSLTDNQLSDSIPVELGNLERLSHLRLHNNQLSGSIPGELGYLNNLKSLLLNGNQLSGEIPAELGNLGLLSRLELSSNQLSGNIPIEFGNLNSLKFLSLFYNELSGEIPVQLGSLSNLEHLHAGFNQLSGNIPSELSNLINLQELSLQHNQLGGTIPSELGNLINLELLSLRNNELSGDIPPELGNLNNLARLYLQYNQLSGHIPPELANLSKLRRLFITYNQLSGCFTPELFKLCSQLSEADVSQGNNFDAAWEELCNTGTGSCAPITASAVWPGDFNSDGIVDNVDVLTWGLAEGNTGIARPNATNDWIAQPCPDWQTSVGSVNGKHQDGDGNGRVDEQDLQVLVDNYGSTHTPASTNSPLQFRLEEVSSTQSDGQIIITYHLIVESSLGMPVSTHGLSCSIDFGNLMINSVTADLLNSSLVPDEYIQIFNAQNNTFNLALTRTDHNNRIIDGPVAVIIVAHEDLQSGEPFVTRINNGRMMSANGELNPTGSTSLYGIVGASGANSEPLLSIFATDESCYTLGTATAQVIGGTAPYTYTWSNGANTAEAENLTAGMYTVEITDANGYTQSMDVEINPPTPIYNEFGNQIDCSQYIQWVNPRIHVWLEGAYRTETGDMRADMLGKLAELPPVQPYGEAPWNYRGIEGEGWSIDNYPADAVDWVLVSFRDSENFQEVYRKTAALVLQNGELHFLDSRVLPTTSTPVYVMIQHRNHIAVMTPQPIYITNNTLAYDFRTSDSYRTETSVGQRQMPDGSWAMLAGDCDKSDTGGYDITGQDKIIWAESNGNFAQYLSTDINLDGDVTGEDKILWEINNGSSSTLPK